jgi:hypothetical protein
VGDLLVQIQGSKDSYLLRLWVKLARFSYFATYLVDIKGAGLAHDCGVVRDRRDGSHEVVRTFFRFSFSFGVLLH